MNCTECLYYERCDTVFDGVLSNRDNKPCDQYINKEEYDNRIMREAASQIFKDIDKFVIRRITTPSGKVVVFNDKNYGELQKKYSKAQSPS